MTEQQNQARYNRQVLFRHIGSTGQQRLAESRVALVGAGALGTVIATQLVRAGVGFVRIIDRDIIEMSNLQRQSLYHESDAEQGLPKAIVAKEMLEQANSAVQVEAIVADVTWRNAEALLSDVDVILDGTDNFQIRYLINDVSVKHQIPWAYGGAVSSYGSAGFFRPGQTPCLVCMFGPNQGGGHDTCDTVGVIAPIIHVIASLQVSETLKYLTGNLEALSGGLTYVDVWSNDFRKFDFPPADAECPCCVGHTFSALDVQQDALTVSLCGRQTIQVRPDQPLTLSMAVLAERLATAGRVMQNPHLLRAEIGDKTITLFPDGRALIHGTDDPVAARNLYARYVGM